VVEDILSEVALPRVLPEGHPLDALEISFPVISASREFRVVPGGAIQNPPPPLAGIRVGREEARDPVPILGSGGPPEHLEHTGHRPRVVVQLRHVAKPQIVGLPLRLPGVPEKEELKSGAGHLPEGLQIRRQDHPESEPQLGDLGPTHPHHPVARRDVADLMAHDPRHLGIGVQVGQDPPGHVNVAPGQGEGVDGGIVQDPEGPGEVGPLRGRRHPLTHVI